MDNEEVERIVIGLTEWRRLMDEKIDAMGRSQHDFEQEMRKELTALNSQQSHIFDKFSHLLDKRFNEIETRFAELQRTLQKITWVFTGVAGAIGIFWLLLINWEHVKVVL